MRTSAMRAVVAGSLLPLLVASSSTAGDQTPPAAGKGAPASAQTPPQEPGTGAYDQMSLEQLLRVRVLVASMQGDDVFTAPSTVSVINAAMLRRYNVQTVGEALELVPGVGMLRTYLKRNIATFRGILQDQYSNKVLLLVNGVPTWHGSTGEGAFYRIAIHDVERIEVLRGPASVLYGTNAYAGAVNVVLKRADQRRFEVDAGVGERGSYGAGAHAIFTRGRDLSLLVSARSGEVNGPSATFLDERRVSGQVSEFERGQTLTVSLEGRGHSLLANAYQADESYLGIIATYASGAGFPHAADGLLLGYNYTRSLGSQADLKAGLSYDRSRRDLPRAAGNTVFSDVDGSRAYGFLKSTVRMGQRLSLDLGADYDHRQSVRYTNYERATSRALSENNMLGSSVNEYSAFGEAKYHHGRASLVLGSRLTKNELFGSNVSSRLAAVWALRERHSLKLIWGQSYRAPSLFELYHHTAENTIFGNLDLEPETSDSVEAAYVAAFGDFYVQVLGYHANYDNRIARTRRYPLFVSNSRDTSQTFVNGKPLSADGAELELTYHNPRRVDAFVNLGYVRGDRASVAGSSEYNFRYVPETTVSAGLSRQMGRFSASSVLNWLQSTAGPKADVPASTMFDAALGYEHGLGRANNVRLHHSLFAKDLFDSDAQTAEYVRRNLNSVKLGLGRQLGYRLRASF